MRLVEKHVVKPSSSMFAESDDLAFRSKNLYNRANYSIRQQFFESGLILKYETLDKTLQNEESYKALPRKVSQQILMVLARNWKAWAAAIKEYAKNPTKFLGEPRIPGYKDKVEGRNVLIYTIQSLSKLSLKKGIINPSQTSLSVKTKVNNVNQVRIVPRLKHYVIEVVYERDCVDNNLTKNNIAAIDIGVDNLAAVTSNHKGFKPILVSGRHVKSVNQFYNKRKAELQEKLKGNKKTSNRIAALANRRNRKVDYYLHCASAYIIKTLVAHDIGTLVIGKNDGWKQDSNIGKQNNQNFVCIPHARFIQQLEYKAELAGITVVITEESYTSRASFLDNDIIPVYGKTTAKPKFSGRRVKRGLYKSKDGTLINADINGSANILRKVFPKAFAQGIEAVVVQPPRLLVK